MRSELSDKYRRQCMATEAVHLHLYYKTLLLTNEFTLTNTLYVKFNSI